jgi:SHS2 domain-containing protein
MSYQLREHTADVAVEATGADLDSVFAAVGDGLAAAMAEEVPNAGERFAVDVTAESREALLFDYLDELIYQRDVRSVLPVANEVAVARPADADRDVDGDATEEFRGFEWQLTGSARGVPLAGLDAREVKAVTYSEMALEATDSEWRAYVVFDV